MNAISNGGQAAQVARKPLDFGGRRHPRPEELDMDSIALHYPVKHVGDSLALGDVVCLSLEDEPSARVVGYLKSDQPGMKIVLRFFAPGDGWIPTGEYRRAGMFWPWRGHRDAKLRALRNTRHEGDQDE
jgi:hypothetical protein